jgi:hypothetical protein
VSQELKVFAIKLAGMLFATPIMGWVIMIGGEEFEKAWKSNSRKKKWLVCCGLFLLLAGIGGWLR